MVIIKDLEFIFSKKQEPLFQVLHCEMSSGSIVGLLGKSGAGKTTLLKLMIGLLRPTHGSVEIIGHQPSDREPSLLQDIYFLSEEIYHPGASIKLYVKANSGFYPRFDQQLLNRLIIDFELLSSRRVSFVEDKSVEKGTLRKCKYLKLLRSVPANSPPILGDSSRTKSEVSIVNKFCQMEILKKRITIEQLVSYLRPIVRGLINSKVYSQRVILD